MADEKELNPSPKVPDGTYPELSPNPNYKDGYIEGEHGIGQPTNPNQEPLTDKPTVFNGEVDINGKLKVNGKEVQVDAELPGTSEATAGQVLKLDAQKKPKWADDTAGMTNPMTTAGDLIVGGASGAPTRLPSGTEGQVLKVGSAGLEWGAAGGGGVDTLVTVEIENDYTSTDFANRTNYATPISLQEFITNCETGVYTNAGTIAKINNLLNEKAFRLILIGNDHEVLAYDDTTTAKTTWQFLDMPEHNVRIGLPFNVIDWVQGSGRAYLKQYLDGTNEAAMQLYPSNMDGLISAQGLLEVCHTVFESLPLLLKEAIKTVRRYYYRKRNYMEVAASGGSETNNAQMCQLACNVFHLAGTDLGTSGQSGEGSGSLYSYFNSNAKRIRFYNGTAASWWTASPYTSASNHWYFVYTDGANYYDVTYGDYGVAPAFCI